MKVNYFSIAYILILLTITSANAKGQQAIRFLEPGITISYDTTQIRNYIRDNTIFRIKNEQTEIKVMSENVGNKPGSIIQKPTNFAELQEYIQNQVNKLRKDPGSFSFTGLDVIDYDKKVQKVGNFIGYGFFEVDKKVNKKYANIYCSHISDKSYTTISLTSYENKPLSHHYKQLESFLKGFKSYSQQELTDFVRLNEKKYTVVVEETKNVLPKFKSRTNEYLAVVKTKEKLTDKVKEVVVTQNGFAEIFEPNENGEVYIACSSKKSEKGIIEREAKFVFISSIGKKIYIPFIIKFERK